MSASENRTVQLRRYELVDGVMDDFLAWYRAKIVPARAAHGFTIEFAYADREVNEFVWAVSTPGDAEAFAEIEKAYLASPEREAAFACEPTRVAVHHVRLVERIV
ncbi:MULTISPECIES: NIPSNAP family protein [unclassified Rathayibacter]|uniref:NIPSNAP family protein n=1 Tax=unclassified Rathayibacter TaxID=2609250 RepID=UPI000F4C7420|nr:MULTISPECIES: NIPSNAP family protein [unclassified Rathayibacter]ROP56861.1 NIPSNAP protein [Rathayibacter sp. PhB186]ROS55246.1 NIPSNAP protein [Rathayibacter sp. PhB185]